MHEVLVIFFVCVFVGLYTKNMLNAQSSRYNSTFFDHLTVYLRIK